jgi:hypothetical protein
MKKRSILRSIVSAAMFAQALVAGAASAEQLPPDEFASPKPGENAPSTILPPEATTPTTGPLEYKVDYDQWYGNSYWGGGYRYYENVRAPSLSFQSVNLDVQARARLFSNQYTAFDISTGTWNPSDTARSARLTVVLANKELFNQSQSSSEAFSTTQVAWNQVPLDKTIFSANKTYGLGPIGINVAGNVHAKFGVNVAATAYRTSTSTSGATFTGTSFAEVYGSMSGGADVWLASGGVRGNVQFVNIHATKSSKSERAGNIINYDTRLTSSLCTLQGDLEIYGSFLGWSGSKTILDWDGYCYNRNWGGEVGSTNLGPTRVIGPIFGIDPIAKLEP